MFESFRQRGSDYGVYFMNFILKEKSCWVYIKQNEFLLKMCGLSGNFVLYDDNATSYDIGFCWNVEVTLS